MERAGDLAKTLWRTFLLGGKGEVGKLTISKDTVVKD